MNTKNAVTLTLILFAVIGTVWYTLDGSEMDEAAGKGARIQCEGEVSPQVGYCAPNFTLLTLDGNQMELYQNQGKPSLINFWASWCEPCKEEMPIIQDAFQKYGEKVNFLMVNETGQDRLENVKSFLKKHQFSFPVLLDRYDEEQKNVGLDRYQAFGIPMTFIVDENGKITHKITGAMSQEQLNQIMEKITN